MSDDRRIQPKPMRLNPEKVAYWYFRLNGFLTIENFVVHRHPRGGQRTDADLLGVRFPHRAESLFDGRGVPMQDDTTLLRSDPALIEIVIVEVTRSYLCKLNGPWTEPDKQNVHRVLAAIGCISYEQIPYAASDLYEHGIYTQENLLRVRLMAVGHSRDSELEKRRPDVVQITWQELVGFLWERLNKYREAKADSQHWDFCGKRLRDLAAGERDREIFVRRVLEAMEERPQYPDA